MTVPEFEVAVEEAIENRPRMRIWEVYDLRLLVKYARLRGEVWNTDVLFLGWAGLPWSGPVYKLQGKPKQAPKKQVRLW